MLKSLEELASHFKEKLRIGRKRSVETETSETITQRMEVLAGRAQSLPTANRLGGWESLTNESTMEDAGIPQRDEGTDVGMESAGGMEVQGKYDNPVNGKTESFVLWHGGNFHRDKGQFAVDVPVLRLKGWQSGVGYGWEMEFKRSEVGRPPALTELVMGGKLCPDSGSTPDSALILRQPDGKGVHLQVNMDVIEVADALDPEPGGGPPLNDVFVTYWEEASLDGMNPKISEVRFNVAGDNGGGLIIKKEENVGYAVFRRGDRRGDETMLGSTGKLSDSEGNVFEVTPKTQGDGVVVLEVKVGENEPRELRIPVVDVNQVILAAERLMDALEKGSEGEVSDNVTAGPKVIDFET